MNAVFPSPSPDLSPAADNTAVQRRPDGSRGLAAMLLAAVVAALVVLADQMISTWVDGHLFLGWVILWVVIFAGSALFSGPARRLARSTLRSLRAGSLALAEARAEMQLWNAARNDHRLMAELMQARNRDTGADADAPQAWGRYPERLTDSRDGHIHLHHV
ncbi:hypothetical protein [Hydrogenophaga sp.]|jgi:hypothetical protein|uniref:hypothetical protein n=1 Tax=Hydrogenophaga sp. TaxID=1904254 RepID=UPI002716FB8F|nr:hypothetical protein [Hydrogenophaga sp.]MDO9146970.1 hypothetical protein [Hydrogenophaga sp.]MDP3326361.1 hypothetical protein [Hydrogenophaga sp.]MDP3885158.1 hypothetical protein [Hydrogenophaga sp.]